MDKNILKKFAIESRQDLMKKIESKIKTFYIDDNFSKQQNGDVYVLSNEKHTLSLTKEEYEKRETLIKRVKELGLGQVIEESAYTWFNRIVAIRYMEINDYLPLTKDNQSLGIRVLSSKDNTPDPEILKFTNLINTDLDIDFKKEKYTELKTDNDKFKYVLLLVCRKLGKVIPQVFDGKTDYIDILIPDNLLNDTGFINKTVIEVPEENFKHGVEIIGWLYQYYIFDLKDIYKKKYNKYNKESLPIMTQIFTNDCIVKYMVENTMFQKLKNYNVDITEFCSYITESNIIEISAKNNLKEFKFIDPCCGSGHILIYAFEILYKSYLKLGYNKKDIPLLIINNNLYGIDIDDRAAQLSILSVLLKGLEYDNALLSKSLKMNIISIKETNNLDCNIIVDLSDDSQKKALYLKEIFHDAKEYGSIIKVDNYNYDDLLKEVEEKNNIFSYNFLNEYNDIIKQAQILTDKYDVLVTNPPYLGVRYFDDKLKKYAEYYYKESKHDLCTIFMDSNLLKENGILGMVNQTTWLTQDSFSLFRKKLLNGRTILSMLILDKNIMDAGLDICTFIIKNKKETNFITNYYTVDNMDNGISYQEKYEIDNDKFLKSRDYAILYNLSNNMYDIYQNGTPLSEIAPTKQGLATSDNNRFLREWYEVQFDKIGFNCIKYEENYKWYPCNKGGSFRKWYGNYNKIINWEYDGKEIKNYASKLYKSFTRTIKNIPLYFKPGITWNSLAKELGCRIVPNGFIFETKGSMMFPKNEDNLIYLLGVTNSKVINKVAQVISPTLDFHEGPVGKLPIIIDANNKPIVEKIVRQNSELSKYDWDSFETSWDFKIHPIINMEMSLVNSQTKQKEELLSYNFDYWNQICNDRFNKLKNNEEELNRIFIEIYGLQDELTPEVKDKDITIRKADRVRDIKSLISYAVGCMFGRYSLDEDGLIYAGGEFDVNRYKTFKADVDNIIPITDDSYFSDDIVARFKTFIEIAYGKKTINENLDYIAESLGKRGTETSEETIRRYFINDFYNDHVKTYQKRPIYWLFDSGKKNGFKALIYMHRYNENTVPKVRLDYLHRIQTTYEKLLTDVNYKLTTELTMTDKKQVQNKQADLNAKLVEIKEYDEKIAHIANQKISIDLDDGVAVNYLKFEEILSKIK